jgi:predicted peptidase
MFKVDPDPRVQMRTYLFKETNENMKYGVFVSSKVAKDKKNPLIVTLHGLGMGPEIMLRGKAIDLAEEGGYILVGPMGYNVQGWYGSPVISMGGPGKQAPAAPANLAELSEEDVMNVLEMVRKEFNVDDKRIYLMGHSMGGAGTLFLGTKYASIWAAIGSIAPAAFMMQPAILAPAKNLPVILVQGDADTIVPPATARRWADKMKELNMTYKYIEMHGGDHGSVIDGSMPEIFAFFKEHTKPAAN